MSAVAALYQAQIESAQYDVFDKKLGTRPPFFALRVWAKTLF
jgi:hypothetical protein